ncbi:MAG: type II toxin-antitoxin system RelE/ParE family toxin [Gammaproteobacteria bacterium]|nr:type II toxin-antitoxin system RelE/ParE family toxin [Gammaproteobacteria bacterium]
MTAIAHYGDENFGIAQSDYYRDQLKQRFSLLAEQPFLYPAVDHIQEGYRRSVHQTGGIPNPITTLATHITYLL